MSQEEGPRDAKRHCSAAHVWPVVPSYYGLARWFPRDVRKLIYSQLTWEEQAVAHIAHNFNQLYGPDRQGTKDGEIFVFAVERGYTSLLRYLCAYFVIGWAKMESKMCNFAALRGQLASLQWLRAQQPPCPWAIEVSNYAAGEGHLELLQWAIENNCPYSVGEMRFFAEGYCRTNVLKWLQTLPANMAGVDARIRFT